MQRNRGQQLNGKDKRSLQENSRYQGNFSCKDGHNKDRNGMDLIETEDIKEVARIHRRTVQKTSS